jgi:Zn finger protein HypA/HybF involved in hydrogenase expression
MLDIVLRCRRCYDACEDKRIPSYDYSVERLNEVNFHKHPDECCQCPVCGGITFEVVRTER